MGQREREQDLTELEMLTVEASLLTALLDVDDAKTVVSILQRKAGNADVCNRDCIVQQARARKNFTMLSPEEKKEVIDFMDYRLGLKVDGGGKQK